MLKPGEEVVDVQLAGTSDGEKTEGHLSVITNSLLAFTPDEIGIPVESQKLVQLTTRLNEIRDLLRELMNGSPRSLEVTFDQAGSAATRFRAKATKEKKPLNPAHSSGEEKETTTPFETLDLGPDGDDDLGGFFNNK